MSALEAGEATSPTGVDSADKIYDMLIVGLGPAGATAANLAGQLGLSTLVIERDPDIYPRQRAVGIDAEALRIIRNMGLYDQVAARMHLGMTLSFVGLNKKSFFDVHPLISEECNEFLANSFHQPWLEGSLREGLRRWPNVELRVGAEAREVHQDEDIVIMNIAEVSNGAVTTVRGRYLLACDGGSSPIRKQLGVEFVGQSYSEQWIDVQATVKRPLGLNPYLQFLSNPERPGVRMPCPAGYQRFEWRVNRGETAEELLAPDSIWRLLGEQGVTKDDIEIQRKWAYTFHVRKCAKWRVGRVFMVGDAAHVMPPFAGQGVSGAFRDASNLVWKVAAVVRGQAEDSLLDTYQEEREPHHDAMSSAAVRIGKLVMPPNRVVAALRDGLFRVVRNIPGVEESMSRAIIKPTPLKSGYMHGGAGTSTIGHLIKSVRVARPGVEMGSIDEALGTGWAILGLNVDPRAEIPPEVLDAWAVFAPHYLAVRPGNSSIGPDELGDPSGELWKWMQDRDVRFVVIRPDRYIYAVAQSGSGLPAPAPTHAALSLTETESSSTNRKQHAHR